MQSTIKFSLLVLMIAFAATPAAAQRMAVKNLEKYDKQLIHFGFLLGINKTNFKVVKADDFFKGDSVLILEPKGQSGFNLGIVTDLRLSDNLNLRFIPELSFSQRDIKYQLIYPNKTTPEVIKKVESTFVNIPLQLKFKSKRVGNYRFYVIGGMRYAIDLVSQANVQTENDVAIVKLKREDYGYDIGFGMDCYLELFKFSPEIKVFQGLPNILAEDAATFTTSINSLRSRIFTLSFTFE